MKREMLEGRVLVSNCYESLSKSSFQIGLLFSDVFIYLHFQPLADQSQPPDQNRQKSVRRKMLRHLSKRCPIRRQLERAWCVSLSWWETEMGRWGLTLDWESHLGQSVGTMLLSGRRLREGSQPGPHMQNVGQFVNFENHFKRFKSGKTIMDLSKIYKFKLYSAISRFYLRIVP